LALEEDVGIQALPMGLLPRLELQERQSVRSGPSAPPSATGTRWSAVRSSVAPQIAQRGLAAMVARARARFVDEL
jgi:hypothetical protein